MTARQASLPINRALIREVLRRVACREGWGGDLSVAILDDAAIARAHEKFLGLRGPTDVLAFDYRSEGGGGGAGVAGVAGEILVSAESAKRVAARLDEEPERELVRYCVHGLLHLCVYDDRTRAQRRRMEAAQEEALREFWA